MEPKDGGHQKKKPAEDTPALWWGRADKIAGFGKNGIKGRKSGQYEVSSLVQVLEYYITYHHDGSYARAGCPARLGQHGTGQGQKGHWRRH